MKKFFIFFVLSSCSHFSFDDTKLGNSICWTGEGSGTSVWRGKRHRFQYESKLSPQNWKVAAFIPLYGEKLFTLTRGTSPKLGGIKGHQSYAKTLATIVDTLNSPAAKECLLQKGCTLPFGDMKVSKGNIYIKSHSDRWELTADKYFLGYFRRLRFTLYHPEKFEITLKVTQCDGAD